MDSTWITSRAGAPVGPGKLRFPPCPATRVRLRTGATTPGSRIAYGNYNVQTSPLSNPHQCYSFCETFTVLQQKDENS